MHYCSDPVQTLANVLAHAQYEGFPEIEYEDRDWSQKEKVMVTKTRRHRNDDIAVIAMFPQAWSSTALGFGGLGGQAITTAYTIVLKSEYWHGYAVYFGSRFAYMVAKANEQFYLDLQAQHMAEVASRRKYEKEVE